MDVRILAATNCDLKKAFVFQGSDSEPQLKAEFKYDWPLGEGLFILGKDALRGEFVFHYMSFLWGKPDVIPLNLWGKVSKQVSGNVVPLVVYSSKTAAVSPSLIEKAREIKNIIGSWADAWRGMDLDKLIHFYGNIFTNYLLNLDKPLVYTRDQLYKTKQAVWRRSGFISVKISDPVYIVDPTNQKMAIAVFYQEYRSKIYADKGTKVLYFSLVDEPGGKQTWKIVAKLWLPR